MVCNTSATYSDAIYLYICTNCCNTAILLVMYLARKGNVDDSGFPKDTRQTTGVVWLLCAAVRSLEDNDRHMWAI